MPSIADIREQFPQYEDISDEELLQGLHRKHYSDMEYDEFRGKIEGLDTVKGRIAAGEESVSTEELIKSTAENIGKSAIGNVASLGKGLVKFGQGATQSLYMLGEFAGVLDEGSAQRITDIYNKQNEEWDEDLSEFLGVDSDSDVMKVMKGAEFVGEAAPLLAIPAAGTGMTLPARVATETAVGATLGHALYQEDLDDKATAATITGAVSAAIPIVGGVVRAGVARGRGKQIDRVVQKTQELIGEGYKPTQALRSALWKVRPSVAALEQHGIKDVTTKGIKKSLRKEGVFSHEAVAKAYEDKVLREGTFIGQLKSRAGELTKPVGRQLEKVFTPTASRLENLGLPRLASAFRRHDMESHILIQNRLGVKDKLISATKDLNSVDKRNLKRYLLNGEMKNIDELAARNSKTAPELLDAVKEVRSLLDDMYKESRAVGADVGFLKDFFPREIKDYRKYAAKRGIPYSRVSEELAKAINKKHGLTGGDAISRAEITNRIMREHLTDDEIARVLADKVFKGKGEGSADFLTKHGYSRTKEFVKEADLDDYAELGDSLTNYIVGTTTRNQTRKFFDAGKKGFRGTDAQVAAQGVKALSDELIKQGRVLGDDVVDLTNLMHHRFVAGSKSPARAVQGAKNLMYSSTLGNPLAAMTQLGDMGAAAYLNGFSNAIPSLVRTLTGNKRRIRLEDLGLDTLAHELEHVGRTAKILQKSLKWGQFARVDRWGKETIMNSTLGKLRKQALTAKGRKEIINKYREMYTSRQMNKLLTDLRAGRNSEDVKMALWTELSKVQPISLSEMPEYYLRFPNGRIFYMLKTFTLKQLDLARREAFSKIASGKIAEGTANLVRLGAIIGMANGGVEQAKGFITGKDVDFSDAFFANVLRNYAMSEYTLKKIKQGKPVEAAIDYATPPFGVFESPFRDVAEGAEKARTLKDMPVFGKVLWHFLGYGDE